MCSCSAHTSAFEAVVLSPKARFALPKSRSMLLPLPAARQSLLLLSLRPPALSLRLREIRLPHHLFLGSSSEFEPLELQALLERLEEGVRDLSRLLTRRSRRLRSASQSACSELLEKLVESERTLVRFRVTLLRLRRSFQEPLPRLLLASRAPRPALGLDSVMDT